jgi:transmembrane sensor
MSNQQIMDEAADWIVALRGDGERPAAREEFAAWLCRSPEHVRVYLDLAGLWSDLGHVDRRQDLDVQTLVQRALATGNVVSLDKAERADAPRRRNVRRYRLAAAALLAISLGLGGMLWQSHRYPTYTAGVGEQRSITLSDGSIIELNSRSRVRVRFSPAQRSVELLEGQGLFRVAHDPARPFVVRSDEVRVRAVGTQFDVYRKPAGPVVTVLEGKVEISGSAAAPADDDTGSSRESIDDSRTPRRASVRLAAGEQVTVVKDRASAPRAANVEAATAWTQHQLVFDSATLAEVAHEFNRYNRRQLVVADPGLESVLINGVFSSTDPAALLRFLRAQSDLEVQETGTEVRIVRRSR